MAWTAPRTWTDGELVTKAIMDPHIRDNFLAVGPHLIARKTADQAVVGSTTLVNDTHLSASVAANEHWHYTLYLLYDAPTTGDLKVGFTFPTGRAVSTASHWSAAGAIDLQSIDSGASATTLAAGGFGGNAAGSRLILVMNVIFVNGGGSGTFQLQWAQNAASGTTNMFTDSTLWGVKLA